MSDNQKYLKYKSKYIALKSQCGGNQHSDEEQYKNKWVTFTVISYRHVRYLVGQQQITYLAYVANVINDEVELIIPISQTNTLTEKIKVGNDSKGNFNIITDVNTLAEFPTDTTSYADMTNFAMAFNFKVSFSNTVDKLLDHWYQNGGSRSLSEQFVESLCVILKNIKFDKADVSNLQIHELKRRWDVAKGSTYLRDSFVASLCDILEKKLNNIIVENIQDLKRQWQIGGGSITLHNSFVSLLCDILVQL
jgi:hypothetical protein